jgi:hypothetical protein
MEYGVNSVQEIVVRKKEVGGEEMMIRFIMMMAG